MKQENHRCQLSLPALASVGDERQCAKCGAMYQLMRIGLRSATSRLDWACILEAGEASTGGQDDPEDHRCPLPDVTMLSPGYEFTCHCGRGYVVSGLSGLSTWAPLNWDTATASPEPKVHECKFPNAADLSRGTGFHCHCGKSYVCTSIDGTHVWVPARDVEEEPAPRPVEDLSELVSRMRRVEDAEYLWQEVDLAGTPDGGVVYQCLHESCPKTREPLCYLRSRTGAQPNDAPVEVLHFHELLIFIRDHLARYHTTDGRVPDLWRPNG